MTIQHMLKFLRPWPPASSGDAYEDSVAWAVSRAVQPESKCRKDFQPEESESQKILTTPTAGWPFARRMRLFQPETCGSVTLVNLRRLTFQQEMIVSIQKGCSALTCRSTLRSDSRSAAYSGSSRSLCWLHVNSVAALLL